MSKNVAPLYPAIRLRLSPAQIAIIAPGIEVITRSYKDHLRAGTSKLSYPFRMFPQARGFDRGLSTNRSWTTSSASENV